MSAVEQRKALLRVLEAWRQVQSNVIAAVSPPPPPGDEPPSEGNERPQERPQAAPPR